MTEAGVSAPLAALLAALLVERAADLEGAEVVSIDGGLELVLDGERFGIVAGGAVELRLRREVAAAALRTPDTTASSRGPGWVRFEPPALDAFARDRAAAWLESAWRFADEGGIDAPLLS
jgi:hypothetical protein